MKTNSSDWIGLAIGLAAPSVAFGITPLAKEGFMGGDFDKHMSSALLAHVGALVALGFCVHKGLDKPSIARGAAVGFASIAASIHLAQLGKTPSLIRGFRDDRIKDKEPSLPSPQPVFPASDPSRPSPNTAPLGSIFFPSL